MERGKKAGWKAVVYAALSWHGLSDSGVPGRRLGIKVVDARKQGGKAAKAAGTTAGTAAGTAAGTTAGTVEHVGEKQS